jgi:hypothetical protein
MLRHESRYRRADATAGAADDHYFAFHHLVRCHDGAPDYESCMD